MIHDIRRRTAICIDSQLDEIKYWVHVVDRLRVLPYSPNRRLVLAQAAATDFRSTGHHLRPSAPTMVAMIAPRVRGAPGVRRLTSGGVGRNQRRNHEVDEGSRHSGPRGCGPCCRRGCYLVRPCVLREGFQPAKLRLRAGSRAPGRPKLVLKIADVTQNAVVGTQLPGFTLDSAQNQRGVTGLPRNVALPRGMRHSVRQTIRTTERRQVSSHERMHPCDCI